MQLSEAILSAAEGACVECLCRQTKGKGFRHEKTKKKRGTYKGGKIDDFQVWHFCRVGQD